MFTRTLFSYLLFLNRYADILQLVEGGFLPSATGGPSPRSQHAGCAFDPQLKVYAALVQHYSGQSGAALELVTEVPYLFLTYTHTPDKADCSFVLLDSYRRTQLSPSYSPPRRAARRRRKVRASHAIRFCGCEFRSRFDEALAVCGSIISNPGNSQARPYSLGAECALRIGGFDNMLKVTLCFSDSNFLADFVQAIQLLVSMLAMPGTPNPEGWLHPFKKTPSLATNRSRPLKCAQQAFASVSLL